MNKTILVADDQYDIRFIAREFLSAEGFNVVTAKNGTEALAEIERAKPDLIVLDIGMPDIDGLTLLKKLKRDLNTCSIPVVFLTARAGYEDVMRGYQEQADYYITKPFNKEQLLRGIKIILGNAQPLVTQK